MVRAVGENTFQPKIGFKTRYGMVSNPFVGTTPANGLASDEVTNITEKWLYPTFCKIQLIEFIRGLFRPLYFTPIYLR